MTQNMRSGSGDFDIPLQLAVLTQMKYKAAQMTQKLTSEGGNCISGIETCDFDPTYSIALQR